MGLVISLLIVLLVVIIVVAIVHVIMGLFPGLTQQQKNLVYAIVGLILLIGLLQQFAHPWGGYYWH